MKKESLDEKLLPLSYATAEKASEISSNVRVGVVIAIDDSRASR
jgi:hypothetical protein